MRMRVMCFIAVSIMAMALAGRAGMADESKGDPKDKEAIAKNADAFVEAFHKGDADAVAAFWTPDGDYTDETGRHMKGRETIATAFKALFTERKGLKLRIDSDTLRFVTADVAIEDGMTSVISPDDGPPSRVRYTIVHVKKDGQWLLSSVRDAPYAPPSNYEHLRGMEWAIGDWTGEGETGAAEHFSLAWTNNQNFIVGSFAASVKGVAVGGATHWIGWDPVAKNVRSWIFDATGGFGEGAWSREDGKMAIKTTSVLRDGTKASATIVIGRGDDDTITLQSMDRTVAGKAVPDSKEVKLKRAK